jgi:ankyrin repeat protein
MSTLRSGGSDPLGGGSARGISNVVKSAKPPPPPRDSDSEASLDFSDSDASTPTTSDDEDDRSGNATGLTVQARQRAGFGAAGNSSVIGKPPLGSGLSAGRTTVAASGAMPIAPPPGATPLGTGVSTLSPRNPQSALVSWSPDQQLQQQHTAAAGGRTGTIPASVRDITTADSEGSEFVRPLAKQNSMSQQSFQTMQSLRAAHSRTQLVPAQPTASDLRRIAQEQAQQTQRTPSAGGDSSDASTPQPRSPVGTGSSATARFHLSPHGKSQQNLNNGRAGQNGAPAGGNSSPRGFASTTTLDPEKPVNGTFKVRKIINDLTAVRKQFKTNFDSDVGDAQLGAIAETRRKLEDAKVKAAQAIMMIGERITVEAFEVRKQTSQLMEDIFHETDRKPGNGQLLTAMARIISLEMPMMVIASDWVQQAVRDGSAQYFSLFLGFPEVVEACNSLPTLQTLIDSITANVSWRGLLFSALFSKMSSIPGFTRHKVALTPHWQRAFEELMTKSKSEGDDSSQGRVQSLEYMIREPNCLINFMAENPKDHQTIVSRFAKDGEANLLYKLLTDSKEKPGVPPIDINKVQSDGSTALIQAVLGNAFPTVALLLKQPNIDLFKSHPSYGNAVEIAVKRRADPRIINMLRELAAAKRSKGEEEPEFMLSAEELKAKAKREEDSKKVVDGTQALKAMLIGAVPLFEHVQRLVEENTNTKIIREASENLEKTKANLIQKIHSTGSHLTLEEPQMEQMIDVVHLSIRGTDRRGGSVDLLKIIFSSIEGISWAKHCVAKKWLLLSAAETSSSFLDLLLALPSMKEMLPVEQVKELLLLCANNRTLRIPMVSLLMKHEEVLQFDVRRDLVSPIFQDFFANIASTHSSRVFPREDRNGRMELLAKLVRHPYIFIDPEIEQKWDDKMSIFHRACAEGDVELVALLTEGKGGNLVRDLNRPLLDGSTPLLKAVQSGSVPTVQVLVKRGADPSCRTPFGTPLELAKTGSDPFLVSVLEGHGPLSDFQPLQYGNHNNGGGGGTASGSSSARSLGSHTGSMMNLKRGERRVASSSNGESDSTSSVTPRIHE